MKSTDFFARQYGASSYYNHGILVPRGSRGRTPWVGNLDLAVKYTPKWAHDKLTLGLDVFNMLASNTVLAVWERAELGTGDDDTRYKRARTYTTPRYVRLSATYSY